MTERPVIFIASDTLGGGDRELGEALMLSALKNMLKIEPRPACLLFMNAGVKLCCTGSKALRDIEALAAAGVEILCCGTCLDYYGLVDELRMGRSSNMVEILGRQAAAPVVMRL